MNPLWEVLWYLEGPLGGSLLLYGLLDRPFQVLVAGLGPGLVQVLEASLMEVWIPDLDHTALRSPCWRGCLVRAPHLHAAGVPGQSHKEYVQD